MAMYENDEIDITGVSLFDLERVLDPNEPLNKELVVAPPDFSISYIGFNTSMAPFRRPQVQASAQPCHRQGANRNRGSLRPGGAGIRHIATRVPRLQRESGWSAARQGARPAAPERVQLRRRRVKAADRHYRARHRRHDWAGPRGRDRDVAPGPGAWKSKSNRWNGRLISKTSTMPSSRPTPVWAGRRTIPIRKTSWIFCSTPTARSTTARTPTWSWTPYWNGPAHSRTHKARISEYRRAEEIIVEDGAWVPLWYTGERHLLLKPHVDGYRVTPMIVPKLREVRIN